MPVPIPSDAMVDKAVPIPAGAVIDSPPPNLVQRGAKVVSDFARDAAGNQITKMIPGMQGAMNVLSMAASPLTQHVDPSGKGQPLPMGTAIAEDVGGGLVQGLGAVGGEAVGGPLGAMAGAGAGATAADIAAAKYNQQMYGWGYQPTAAGLAGTFAIGAATEGLPRGFVGAQQGLLTRKLTKEATKAGEEGVSELYNKELPEQSAIYEAVPAEKAKLRASVEDEKARARGEVATNTLPRAAQSALEDFVGQQPKPLAPGDAEKFLARRNAAMAQNTVWNPKNSIAEEYSRAYELAAPHETMVKPAGDLKTVNDGITKALDQMQEKGMGAPSPRVLKLVHSIQQTGDSDWGVVAAIEGSKEANRLLKGDPAALEQRAALNRRVLDQMRDKGLAPPVPTLSNADLLNFSRMATSMIGREDGPSSVVASKLRDLLLDKLDQTGVKIPPDLNMQYGRYKKVFDDSFIRQVGSSIHPEEYAGDLFKSAVPGKAPDRFDMLMRRADPGQKVALRNLFRDWAMSVGPKGINNLIEKRQLSPAVPKALFGDSAWAKFEPWTSADAKSMGWEQLLTRVSPAMRQQMIEDAKQGMASGVKEIAEDASRKIAGVGKDFARKLGPAGNGLMAQFRDATPLQAARITQQVIGKAMNDVPQIMPEPGTAEMASYRNSKAIQKGVDISARRQEAAVAQIAKMAKAGDPVTKKALQKLQWYGPLLVALSATGAISPYLLAAGSFAALESVLFNPRRAMLKALETEEGSNLFYKAISARPNSLNGKAYSDFMGRAQAHSWKREVLKRAIPGAAAQQGASALGLSAGIPPEGEGE